MKKLLIILSVLILVSCGEQYRLRTCRKLNCCTPTKDSTIIITHTTVDSTATQEAETWLSLWLSCNDENQVILTQVDSLKSKNNNLLFKFDSLGHLVVDAYIPVHKIPCPEHTDSIVYRDRVVQANTTPCGHIPTKFDKFCYWWFGVTAFLILCGVVIWVVKKFVKK